MAGIFHKERTVEIDGRKVPLRIRTSRRARNLLLSVDASDDAIDLVLPPGTPIYEGLRFVESRARWLAGRIRSLPERVPLVDGEKIPVLGHQRLIRHRPDLRGGVWMEGGEIYVSGNTEHQERRVTDWLRRTAKTEISTRAHDKADQIGRRIDRVTIRDTRSLWGSCTEGGRLSFSWRLVLAPVIVLDYVVAHEVAHLAELNHSRRFWDIVAELTEDTKRAKAWLHAYGQTLHRYG
jgi:hypothetical protein